MKLNFLLHWTPVEDVNHPKRLARDAMVALVVTMNVTLTMIETVDATKGAPNVVTLAEIVNVIVVGTAPGKRNAMMNVSYVIKVSV